jgi:Protein of unknown function (DUF1553)/Protein of unknown function (DUF1549)/Planctomycete cytochrome C
MKKWRRSSGTRHEANGKERAPRGLFRNHRVAAAEHSADDAAILLSSMRSCHPALIVFVFASTLPAAEAPPDFARDVRPILSRYCFKCHGPDESARKSNLRLDQRDAAISPAKSGKPAIVPGKSDETELLRRIFSTDADEVMPPPATKTSLTAAQKDTLRRWIGAGAEYQEHWAFIPPRRPAVPPAPQGTHPVDAFLRARLSAAGLEPSPPADAATLVRRLSLDLVGLPPSPQEVNALVPDQISNLKSQILNLTDRLLASPRYGERWARKWLDLARYADTNGYEKDRPRQIWPWRDWVVNALNADLPFDRFTVEQIAGDMLPDAAPQQIIATGFHRNTMLNEEGGIDPLEFRFHAMTDRVAVTGATWLGLTLQCAQCHTHKFDPVPHREYYQIMAFLNNADEPDFAIRPPDADLRETERQAKREKLIGALPDKWPAGELAWKTLRPLRANSGGRILDDGSVLYPVPGPDKATYSIELDVPDNAAALRLEALTDESLPSRGPGRTPHGNFVLNEITIAAAGQPAVISSATATAEQNGLPVNHAFDGHPDTGWAVHEGGKKLNETKSAAFRLVNPVRGKLTVTLAQNYGGGHTIGRLRLSAGAARGQESPRAAAERAFEAWLAREHTAAVNWVTLKPECAVSNSPLLTVLPDNSVLASGDITKADTYDLKFRTGAQKIAAVRLEALPHESLPARGPGMAYYEGPKGDFFMGEFQLASGGQPVKIASATDSYSKNNFGQNVSAARAIDGDPQTGWSTAGGEGRAHEAVFVLENPLTLGDGTLSLRMMFGRHYACSLGRFRVSITTAPRAAASTVDGEVQNLLGKSAASLANNERDRLRTAFLLAAPELAGARREIDELSRPASHQTTLVMRERPATNPRPTHIHHRGEFVQPGAAVQPAVLSVLNPLPNDAPRDRLAFARWLVSRDNPLTARVVVNRHWAAFFGRGLVRTLEDFGYQGELPSHPELLDWLAVEFMESGWSVKKLHRLIVTSAAYQQSSRVAGRGVEIDPDNTLLWRGPRHRLEAEQIRDSALAVCGLLSLKTGGPGVFPPQPAGVTTEGTYGAMEWKPATGEDRYRRSLYTFTKRTAPFAMSNTFDAPTGEACLPRRDVSNTPLQSLTLLNDVMFMEAAQTLAKQVAADPGSTGDKLRSVFLRIFSRPADDDEVTALLTFFIAQEQRFAQRELDPVKTAGDGADPARAAWTLTIRALLNTDEFVTKH